MNTKKALKILLLSFLFLFSALSLSTTVSLADDSDDAIVNNDLEGTVIKMDQFWGPFVGNARNFLTQEYADPMNEIDLTRTDINPYHLNYVSRDSDRPSVYRAPIKTMGGAAIGTSMYNLVLRDDLFNNMQGLCWIRADFKIATSPISIPDMVLENNGLYLITYASDTPIVAEITLSRLVERAAMSTSSTAYPIDRVTIVCGKKQGRSADKHYTLGQVKEALDLEFTWLH